jgi:two-component system, response regulator
VKLEKFEELEIILVEDNPYDAELTVRALRNQGLANGLKLLTDGEEALDFIFAQAAGNGHPKVILLDLKLPKIDGLEVLRRLKSDERTKMIPVVVLSSSKENSDILSSYQYGVNSYIVKPVDFDKFLKAVGELGFYWLLINKVPS